MSGAVMRPIDEFPLTQRQMATDVPRCPACMATGTAIRERVMRGDAVIDFWCCPPCGARWRVRPDEEWEADAVEVGA